MAGAVQKITLSSSRDIPFNKLVLSRSNVRRVQAGVTIEDLATDIASSFDSFLPVFISRRVRIGFNRDHF
jgi:hypothetical protein